MISQTIDFLKNILKYVVSTRRDLDTVQDQMIEILSIISNHQDRLEIIAQKIAYMEGRMDANPRGSADLDLSSIKDEIHQLRLCILENGTSNTRLES